MRPAPADRRSDLLGLGTFVMLGLPDGMLGTAWPAMRQSLHAPIGDLGLILLINTAGSVVVAAFTGRLLRRLGVSGLIVVAACLAALGGAGFASAAGLWLVLGIGPLMGAAAGLMDGGLNTVIGLSGRPRLLNLLHGFYGIGTASGPLLVTAAVLTASWRAAYLALIAVDLLGAALWASQLRRERKLRKAHLTGTAAANPKPGDYQVDPQDAHPAEGWSRNRYVTVVVLGMAIFFVYTGLEVSAGQWETSFLRIHLRQSVGSAGLATFAYWGALTAVRIILALPARAASPDVIVRWGAGLALAATAVIWWQPDVPMVVAAFALLGAALAGVFPALVALTPHRIGVGRAGHVIAWQVGAAAAGGSAVSAATGFVIGVSSLAALGPVLVIMAMLLLIINAVLTGSAPLTAHGNRRRGRGLLSLLPVRPGRLGSTWSSALGREGPGRDSADSHPLVQLALRPQLFALDSEPSIHRPSAHDGRVPASRHRLGRIAADERPALPAGCDSQTAVDQECQASEHPLLGNPTFLTVHQLTDSLRQLLVIGHPSTLRRA